MTEAPHRPDPNPGIQARESVGGITCSPQPAGEPSTVTRDRAYLEDPAVAFWIVQEGERVPVAARPLGSSHPSVAAPVTIAITAEQLLSTPPPMADQWPIASHQKISTSHYSLESPLAPLLPAYSHCRSILRGEQCTRGALLAPTKAEGAAGWWPTSRNSRWVARPITLASWPLTTNSTCLATASPRAVPGFDVVLRPTKSVSILYGLGDPATGRAVLAAHHAGVAEAVAYLDTHIGTRRGHGGHEHVAGQGLLGVGFDHRTSREGDPLLHPTWWWPTGSRGRTAAGQRWTAGTCIGIGWPPMPSIGPATSASCPGRSGSSGQQRTPTGTGSWRACPRTWSGWTPSERTGLTWRWSGWRPRGGSGPAAGQVGRPCHSQAQRPPGRGHLVWTVADGGGRAGPRPGHPAAPGDRPDRRPRPSPVRADGGRGVRAAGGPRRTPAERRIPAEVAAAQRHAASAPAHPTSSI